MRQAIKRRRSRSGFTLIELLIVVVVIGILATIALLNFNYTKQKAFRGSMVSDLKNMANHQEIYRLNNYTYTSSISAMGMTLSSGVAISVNEATVTGWAGVTTHSGVPAGNECGLFYGDASAANAGPATLVGVVECNF